MAFGTGDLLQSLQQGVIAINDISRTLTNAQSTSGTTPTVTAPTVFFNTRTDAIAATIAIAVQAIETGGYSAAGDGGGALYKKVGGSTTGGFQSTDGAWWQLGDQVIDPRMLGCIIDGSTDNTTNLQNAFTVAGAGSGELRIPNTIVTGGLAFTGNISVTAAMTISGVGSYNSMLLGTGGATQGMIDINVNNPVHFRDVWINTTTANMTGGYAIKFNGTGGSPQNDFTTIERVQFSNLRTALDFEVAAYWSVKGCVFQLVSNSSSTQIIVRNTASGDAGDSEIVGNWFIGGFNNTTYINWQSSGGLRVARNKFIGVATVGTMLEIDEQGTITTGLLSVVDNSFDSPFTGAISLTTSSSQNGLSSIHITGNRFDNSVVPGNGFIFVQNPAGSTLGPISINNNIFTGVGGGTTAVTVALADTVTVNSNIFGGITSAVAITTVGGATVIGNLLGGATISPSTGSSTVLVANNF